MKDEVKCLNLRSRKRVCAFRMQLSLNDKMPIDTINLFTPLLVLASPKSHSPNKKLYLVKEGTQIRPMCGYRKASHY